MHSESDSRLLQSNNIKTLLIDFDGTICFDRFWRSADGNIQSQIKSYLFDTDDKLVNDWLRGYYTSEQVNKRIADTFDYRYEDLWDIFVKDCQTMFIRPKTLELIQRARSKYKIILLTDNMDCFDRFTIPSLQLDKCFDQIINSYNYGVTKADINGGLFACLNMKTLEGGVFIDNSDENCQSFKKLGGQSYLVNAPTDIDLILSDLL